MSFISDPSLVLFLPLYEMDGESIVSRDARGHPGTVNGAVWRPDGMHFEGNGWINCGDSPVFDITGEITVEAWVKIDVKNAWYQIAGRDDVTNRNYFLDVEDSNRFVFYIYSGGASKSGKGTAGDLTTGVWYHAAGTYDKQNVKVYTNSVEGANVTPWTGNIDNDDVPLEIGARKTRGDFYLNGSIGEIRIYSRALTASEVLCNYLATKWRYR